MASAETPLSCYQVYREAFGKSPWSKTSTVGLLYALLTDWGNSVPSLSIASIRHGCEILSNDLPALPLASHVVSLLSHLTVLLFLFIYLHQQMAPVSRVNSLSWSWSFASLSLAAFQDGWNFRHQRRIYKGQNSRLSPVGVRHQGPLCWAPSQLKGAELVADAPSLPQTS